ncbi:hypothetical protein N431DRAFT_439681 [Stipitochalara longipes BDJ]|nr:hypothetical protein N431DRAFT_439681 [Stipitochalara longipes BDJ]
MSSIAISTNAFGDFSKCTIISDLIKDETMQGIVEESQRILQKFIHQPQTGRCLVFLLVEKQLYVDKFGSLGFELIHWSLNSLLKLNHSLKSTNGAISKAKEDLMAQIRDSPGKRGLVLERMCQEYLGDFEASLVQLETMNFNLEQSMKSLERYDTSLNMESERAESYKTMHQNENIEKLTYLTIVYLPITLMAGIYAIPGEHKVLSDNMGLGWFLGGIFIVSAATYVLAFYIKVVLEFFVLIWRSLFYCLRRISLSPLERSKDCRKKDCEDSGDQRARGPIGDSSSPPDPTRAMEEGAGDRITSETRSNR